MSSQDTGRELEDFLTAGPSWMRKLFKPDSWSPEDLTHLWWWRLLSRNESKLLKLLQPHPNVLREYRERCKQAALKCMVPSAPRGRPRKDALAREAIDLKIAGRSYGQIAHILNLKHGTGTTTREAVIQLIKRKSPTGPDKT
jgi:hypothetical protein